MKAKVTLMFKEDLLGTVPMDKEIYTNFVASKSPNKEAAEEEADGIIDDEKGITGFHKLESGEPFLYDYAIKGFFKDACSMMRRVTDSHSSKLKAHKKAIDGLLFVSPRKIPITVNGEMGILERPLRAQTAQGERIALAKSHTVPAGSLIEFEVSILGGITKKILTEWLDYGINRGIGQWRNAGYGSFEYTISWVE